ncbi:MAG: Crp/Fnr family transcriptional regulator [Candidatus Omnitrophica bacterium]|nr:Crp/Fnr family transcriptional regulator [Candidatus Omnitrophota bacterium]
MPQDKFIFDLKHIPIFQGFSESELHSVKSCLREKNFEKGEILFREGECCNRVFIVQTGRVKIFRTSSQGREQTLETLGAGDTCACNPGSSTWSCSATAEAVTPVRVWFLSRDDYIRMVNSNSKVSHSLNVLFAKRLQSFSSLIEEVSLKDVKKRLVKFILDMLDVNSSRRGEENLISLSFTREEIAQRLGAARETIARYLSELKRDKLIDVKPKQIVILNKKGLESLLF